MVNGIDEKKLQKRGNIKILNFWLQPPNADCC